MTELVPPYRFREAIGLVSGVMSRCSDDGAGFNARFELSDLTCWSNKHEWCPIVGGRQFTLATDSLLSRAQCKSVVDLFAVPYRAGNSVKEVSHHLGCRFVINIPMAADDALGAGDQERLSQRAARLLRSIRSDDGNIQLIFGPRDRIATRSCSERTSHLILLHSVF